MALKEFVSGSMLSQEDKNLWFSVLEGLNAGQVKTLENFVDEKEENLQELTENFKAKRIALENLDENALNKIVESES